jgi:hypothetical protein
VASENVTENQGTDWVDVCIYTLCKGLMKSSGDYGSTSLLFVIKVMLFSTL